MRIQLTDLLPATNYAIQVRTVTTDGSSEWSRRYLFTTMSDLDKPAIPTSLTFVTAGTSFHAEWNSVTQTISGNTSAVQRYELELVAGATTRVVSVPQKTDGSKQSYDLSLDANRALFGTTAPSITARVRAVDNKELKGDYTGPVTATNAAPANPTGLTATAGTNAINLTWTAAADLDIQGYNVYNGASKVGFTNGTNFTYSTTTYTSTTLTVKSVDVFGQESSGVSATTTPLNPTSTDSVAPNVPSITSATLSLNATATQAFGTVVWTLSSPPSDLQGFQIRYRRSGDTNWSQASATKDDLTLVISGLTPYVAYEFQIRSVDYSANFSAWSGTTTATANTNTAPAQVTGLTLVPDKTAITASWTANTETDVANGAGIYEVTFSKSSTFATGNLVYETGASSVTVSGLDAGTQYYVRVRAKDSGGVFGTYSTTANTTTTTFVLSDGSAPASSPTPTVSSGIGYLFVNWTAITNNDPVTYEVHISTTTGFTPSSGTKVAETASTVVSLEKDAAGANLVYGTTYYVKLIAKDRDGSAAAGSQGSGTPAKALSGDVTITPADIGAPTIGDLNTAVNNQILATNFSVNPYFDNWASTLPDGYGPISGVSPIKETTTIRTAPYSFRYTLATTSNAYISVGNVFGGAAVDPYQYYTVTIDFYLVSGSLAGAGAAIDWQVSGANGDRVYINLANEVPAAVTGKWYRVTKTIKRSATATGTATGLYGYLIGNYTVGVGTPSVKDIIFDQFSIRPSTDVEINAYEAPGQITAIQATVNGKNTITYATVAPTTSNVGIVGDTWFVRATPTSAITAQYELSSGTNVWTAKTLDNAVIANLDAGKIQSGFIAAARIQAGTIDATKLIVSIGGGNLCVNSGFEDSTNTGGVDNGTNTVTIASQTSTVFQGTRALSATATANVVGSTGGTAAKIARSQNVTVVAGQKYIVSAWVLVPVGVSVILGMENQTVGNIVHAGTGAWQRVYSQVITATAGSNRGILLSVASGSTLTTGQVVYIDNIQIEQGDVMTAWTPKPDEILPGTISANMLIANTITASSGVIANAAITNAMIANITADKIQTGTLGAQTITIGTGGAIQSSNWASGSAGWKIGANGAEFNDANSSIKAEAIKAGVLGGASGSGVINIQAGTSLIFNGGYLKSNTYTGTAQASNPSGTGFYLGNDGLRIDTGIVSASALTAGTISGTNTITLSGANAKIVGGTWSLSGSGLTIPNGGIVAANLSLQQGENLIRPEYADFEGANLPTMSFVNASATLDATDFRINKQSLKWVTTAVNGQMIWGASTTDWNFVVGPSTTYIVSFYAMIKTGATAASVTPTIKWNQTPTDLAVDGTAQVIPANSTWNRYSTTIAIGSGALGPALMYWKASAATTIYIDGIQVETQWTNSTTPSTWSPPSSTYIDGNLIRTGQIQSNQTVSVNGTPQPLWSINTQGGAQFGNAQVRGSLVVGQLGIDGVSDDDAGASSVASANYVAGSKGWKINSDGSSEFQNVTSMNINSANINGGNISGASFVAKDTTNPDSGSITLDSKNGFNVISPPSLGSKPYVQFPINGAPNIISGQLSASTLSVTSGMSLAGPGTIEVDSNITITGSISSPANAPSLVNDYAVVDSDYPGTGQAQTFTTGHDGNFYTVIGKSVWSINAATGVSAAAFTPVAAQTLATPAYVQFANGLYYVMFFYFGGVGVVQYAIAVYDSTFTKTGEYVVNGISYAAIPTLGYDWTNNRLLLTESVGLNYGGDPYRSFAAFWLSEVTLDGSNMPVSVGSRTQIPIDQYVYPTTAGLWITRGSFDMGADRYIVRAANNTSVFNVFDATSSSVSQVRTNLLTNPSFETNVTGWTGTFTGAALSSVATTSMFGTKSMQMTQNTGGQYQMTAVSSKMTVTPGEMYAASAYAKADATLPANSSVAVYFYWYDSGNNFIGGWQGWPGTTMNTSTFVRGTATGRAPSNAAKAEMVINIMSGSTQTLNVAKAYVDGAMFEKARTIGTYFDGSTTQAGYTYAWTGTANGSTSTETAPAASVQAWTRKTNEEWPAISLYANSYINGFTWNPNTNNFYELLKSGNPAYKVVKYEGGLNWNTSATADTWYMNYSWLDDVESSFTISSKSLSSNVATITTSATHGFTAGDVVNISGSTETAFNGSFYIATTPTATTFTYEVTATNQSGGASGTAKSGMHETVTSPTASLLRVKRSRVKFGTDNFPLGGPVGDTVTKAKIYRRINASPTTMYFSQTETTSTGIASASTLSTAYVIPLKSKPSPAAVTYPPLFLPVTNPAQIVSSTGLSFWKGDDTAQFYQLVLNSNTDANTTAGNKPALRIGDPAGTHMRIDGNELIAMTNDTTQGIMYLNAGGKAVLGSRSWQSGTVSLTCAGGTGTDQANVTFSPAFLTTPFVLTQFVTGVAGAATVVETWPTSVSTTGATIVMARNTATTTTVRWVAIDIS